MRGRDGESPSSLGERGGGSRFERRALVGVARPEQAELVASQPVRRATPADRGREALAEAVEQRIPRGMTEGVVVRLEPVQVEEDERGRACVTAEEQLEILHRLPAVRQA